MKTLIWIIIAIVIIFGGWKLAHNTTSSSPTASSTPTATQQQAAANLPNLGTQATADDIVVSTPASGASVASPIQLSGKARGSWFFEGSAPVAVVDLNGTILGRGTIQAQGEWMTTDFVPFKGSVSFSPTSSTTAAALLFMNDNPSGLASTSKYMALPIFFTTR